MLRASVAVFLLLFSCACASRSDDASVVASVAVTLSPQRAPIGAPVEMTFRLEAAPGATLPREKHVVFVHAVDAAGNLLWTDDHEPTVPVDQWKAGTPVEYTRTLFVPRVAVSGPVEIRVGLYAPATGARLRLTGEASADARSYPVATLDVSADPAAIFTVFGEGWHNPETGSTLGREWRWSKGTGRLAFRNPKQPAELWLELDQPVAGVATPQQVQISAGGTVIDTFVLENQSVTLHRTPLDPAVVGSGDTVELDLVAGQSFVPAAIPALKNGDRRELGIRVFNAYVAPK